MRAAGTALRDRNESTLGITRRCRLLPACFQPTSVDSRCVTHSTHACNRFWAQNVPRSRSSCRRSRFVGRPAPRSRTGTEATISLGGGGGLRSIRHSEATDAPTRLAIGRMTSTIRSRPSSRIRTSSPGLTCCAGLAGTLLTWTCPPRQAAAAADRVLVMRTAQIQLSTRTVLMSGSAATCR